MKREKPKVKELIIGILLLIFLTVPAFAQDEEDLAKKLSNPVASLISVPIQANYDENIGPDEEGSVWKIISSRSFQLPSMRNGT